MLVSLCCAGVLEWQTGKTKDLVSDRTCGFKSHLPHESENLGFKPTTA